MVKDRLKRDPCFDALLDLDDLILVVDQKGEYRVKFEVAEAQLRKSDHTGCPGTR